MRKDKAATQRDAPVASATSAWRCATYYCQTAPELVAKVVEMAKGGDAAALGICLDRLIPPAKAKDDPVSLPTFNDSLADNARAVIKALIDPAA